MNQLQLHNGQIFDLDSDPNDYSNDQLRQYIPIFRIELHNIKNFKDALENDVTILKSRLAELTSALNEIQDTEQSVNHMFNLMKGKLRSCNTKETVINDIIQNSLAKFGKPYLTKLSNLIIEEYEPKFKMFLNGDAYITLKMPPSSMVWTHRIIRWAMSLCEAYDNLAFLEWGSEADGFTAGYLHIRITDCLYNSHKEHMQNDI